MRHFACNFQHVDVRIRRHCCGRVAGCRLLIGFCDSLQECGKSGKHSVVGEQFLLNISRQLIDVLIELLLGGLDFAANDHVQAEQAERQPDKQEVEVMPFCTEF